MGPFQPQTPAGDHLPARERGRPHGRWLCARHRQGPGGAGACRRRHGQCLHGDAQSVPFAHPGADDGGTRALHHPRRNDRRPRHLCALRPGSLRHGRHRAQFRALGIHAALGRGGERSAAPRPCDDAKRSAGPGLSGTAARNPGPGDRRRCGAVLPGGEIRAGASRWHRPGGGRQDRGRADGGQESYRGDGLSRPQG